jgi:hypothetical protein
MPAGVKKPKHKASVEGNVGKIATAIIARLRNQTFYDLSTLKIAVSSALVAYNEAAFQKREGSRFSIFNDIEKEHLRPLPTVPYEVADWKYKLSVNLDCHITYKTNRYSVPYQYVGKKVDLKSTNTIIEIYYKSERIASHKRLPEYSKYQYSTLQEHMPDRFHHSEWDDERIKKWAYSIGPYTGEVIDRLFHSVKIKEQAYNSALSVLKLSKSYSNSRLETACEMALEKLRLPRYRALKSILSSNQDEIYQSKKIKEDSPSKPQGYVRGAKYYGGEE